MQKLADDIFTFSQNSPVTGFYYWLEGVEIFIFSMQNSFLQLEGFIAFVRKQRVEGSVQRLKDRGF